MRRHTRGQKVEASTFCLFDPLKRRGRPTWLRRLTAMAVCLSLLLPIQPARAEELSQPIGAQGAALMEVSTGRLLYADHADEQLPMASTTKVMTAIVVLEHANLTDVVKVDARAQGVEGSSIYLEAGEQLTVEELLYGLMLSSGNDAAAALAYHVSGSIEDFAALMNETAQRIGAEDSHFVNPHGLAADGHYTTAHDLALIACYALKNQDFRRIVSTQDTTIAWASRDYDRKIHNKNKFLTQYEGATGVKIGYTKNAGRCLVASAQRDGMELVAVVLNCPNMFEDAATLMDYGYSNYKPVQVVDPGMIVGLTQVEHGQQNAVLVETAAPLTLPLKESERFQLDYDLQITPLSAPVDAGESAGAMQVSFEDVTLSVPLQARDDVHALRYQNLLARMLEDFYLMP